MTEFAHRKPPESSHIEKDRHEIPIIVGGHEIGKMEFSYFSTPFPLYYLNNIQIQPAYRGEGYGRDAILYFNEYLKQKGKAGVLYDSMSSWVKPKGMYERYGWMKVPHSRFLAFNIPHSGTIEQLSDFDVRRFNADRLERLRKRSTNPERIQ